MESIYVIIKCKRCGRTTILLQYEVEESKKENKYLACAHCGSKHFKEEKATDNLKECMKEHSYKRVKGALRQVE